MFQLELNNTPLSLPTKAKIRISLTNPLFDQDNIARLFSYPIKLPLDDCNRKALQHANRLDNHSAPTIFENAKLYLCGNLFEQGVIEILSHYQKRNRSSLP